MLVLENLSCGYGPFRAVQSLNLKLEEGSVNALIGANGAGKSSTLMSIAGHVKIQEGKIFYENNELNQIAVQNRINLEVTAMSILKSLPPALQVSFFRTDHLQNTSGKTSTDFCNVTTFWRT